MAFPNRACATTQGAPPPPAPPSPGATFYRRPLPPNAVAFSSPEGRAVFASALASGGAQAFFPLIEQL